MPNYKAQFDQPLLHAIARLPVQPGVGYHLWQYSPTQVRGQFFNTSVSSRFTPIEELATGQIIGYDAQTVTPLSMDWEQLIDPLDDSMLTSVDRLVRMLHTLNFFADSSHQERLFLRVNGRFLSAVPDNHGRAFRRVIEALGLSPEQFVIQIPGNAAHNLPVLGFATDNYRRNGFLTGLYASDFVEAGSLIGQLRPDYLNLTLDKSWSASTLPGLVTAADRFRVKLIARQVQDASGLFVAQQHGIEYIHRSETTT